MFKTIENQKIIVKVGTHRVRPGGMSLCRPRVPAAHNLSNPRRAKRNVKRSLGTGTPRHRHPRHADRTIAPDGGFAAEEPRKKIAIRVLPDYFLLFLRNKASKTTKRQSVTIPPIMLPNTKRWRLVSNSCGAEFTSGNQEQSLKYF